MDNEAVDKKIAELIARAGELWNSTWADQELNEWEEMGFEHIDKVHQIANLIMQEEARITRAIQDELILDELREIRHILAHKN